MIHKIMQIVTRIVENSYVNMIIAVGLIIIGFEQLYKQDTANLVLHWKHGMSLYGVLMLFQSVFKILKGSTKAYQHSVGKKKNAKG